MYASPHDTDVEHTAYICQAVKDTFMHVKFCTRFLGRENEYSRMRKFLLFSARFNFKLSRARNFCQQALFSAPQPPAFLLTVTGER